VTDDIDKSLLSGGDFKTFVSGGEFQARLLYKEPFIVRAPFMLCCTNEMPPTADDTEGHHRRILPVKSTDHVYRGSERDTGLTGKLSTKESRQAIFNWIYEGYRRVVSDSGNLEIPECVEALRNSVKENSNTVRRWLFEMRYVPESPDEVTAAGSWHETNKLYEAYKKYCQEEGAMEKNTKTRSGFRDALTVIGFVSRKRAIGWVTYLKVTPEEDYGEEIIGELVKEDNGLPF
jgi:phage/plasmid-associated DNA primase